MKTDKKILTAFILNSLFSVFEFFGGIYTGSIAIISDALHDLGDAVSIGIAYFLEKISKKAPDDKYTYGYGRYSVLGGLITTVILLAGSAAVIVGSAKRLFHPTEVNYDGMLIFAAVGIVVNFLAAFFTKGGHSLNQKAVSLHMLEDVLGWAVVLIGAAVMKFTDISVIDPIMSMGVAAFILIHAAKNLMETADLFLMKAPHGAEVPIIKNEVLKIEGVKDVHHVHLWSMDGENHLAALHAVTEEDSESVKEKIKERLHKFGVYHVTVEIEKNDFHCHEKNCTAPEHHEHGHHHHHH